METNRPYLTAEEIAALRTSQAGPPLRDKVLPLVASAMARVPLHGVSLIGWDVVILPVVGSMVAGVVVAIRGVDRTGPNRELCRFEPFGTWDIGQAEADAVVTKAVEKLREFRSQQARGQS